jgi:hypothetical protein
MVPLRPTKSQLTTPVSRSWGRSSLIRRQLPLLPSPPQGAITEPDNVIRRHAPVKLAVSPDEARPGHHRSVVAGLAGGLLLTTHLPGCRRLSHPIPSHPPRYPVSAAGSPPMSMSSSVPPAGSDSLIHVARESGLSVCRPGTLQASLDIRHGGKIMQALMPRLNPSKGSIPLHCDLRAVPQSGRRWGRAEK